jgi:hypothetical protein
LDLQGVPTHLYIDLEVVFKTVCGTDAAVELTGRYSQRVLKTTSRSIPASFPE